MELLGQIPGKYDQESKKKDEGGEYKFNLNLWRNLKRNMMLLASVPYYTLENKLLADDDHSKKNYKNLLGRIQERGIDMSGKCPNKGNWVSENIDCDAKDNIKESDSRYAPKKGIGDDIYIAYRIREPNTERLQMSNFRSRFSDWTKVSDIRNLQGDKLVIQIGDKDINVRKYQDIDTDRESMESELEGKKGRDKVFTSTPLHRKENKALFKEYLSTYNSEKGDTGDIHTIINEKEATFNEYSDFFWFKKGSSTTNRNIRLDFIISDNDDDNSNDKRLEIKLPGLKGDTGNPSAFLKKLFTLGDSMQSFSEGSRGDSGTDVIRTSDTGDGGRTISDPIEPDTNLQAQKFQNASESALKAAQGTQSQTGNKCNRPIIVQKKATGTFSSGYNDREFKVDGSGNITTTEKRRLGGNKTTTHGNTGYCHFENGPGDSEVTLICNDTNKATFKDTGPLNPNYCGIKVSDPGGKYIKTRKNNRKRNQKINSRKRNQKISSRKRNQKRINRKRNQSRKKR